MIFYRRIKKLLELSRYWVETVQWPGLFYKDIFSLHDMYGTCKMSREPSTELYISISDRNDMLQIEND